MVRAAASGRVDFANADLLGRKWWMRLGWILDELELEGVSKVQAMRHAQYVAGLDPMSGQKAFEYHWKMADECLSSVHAQLFPWLKDGDEEETAEASAGRVKTTWESVFGDPEDPANKRNLLAYRRRLQKMLADAEARAAKREERKGAAARRRRPGKARRGSDVWIPD